MPYMDYLLNNLQAEITAKLKMDQTEFCQLRFTYSIVNVEDFSCQTKSKSQTRQHDHNV